MILWVIWGTLVKKLEVRFDFGGELVIIGDLKKFKMADGGHFEFPAVAKIAHAGLTAIFVW